jgi:8-oxo-dGTP pyrophosphatase MutT (NUDIX family)
LDADESDTLILSVIPMETPGPRPASTVVVLRDGARGPQVFLVRRHEGTAFMGGAHVFPGGRVDAADRDGADPSWCDGLDAARRIDTLIPDDSVAYHVAAARELFEEAGVLLARDAAGVFASLSDAAEQARFRGYRDDVHAARLTLRALLERERLRLALDALVPVAHWVTPPIDVRQFDTRFFLTRVPPHQTPVHDDAETVESGWMRPADAIDASRRDELLLPIPTWTMLRELEPFGDVESALSWARARQIARRQPLVVEREGMRLLVLPGDPLHPEPPPEPPLSEVRFAYVDGRWRARSA